MTALLTWSREEVEGRLHGIMVDIQTTVFRRLRNMEFRETMWRGPIWRDLSRWLMR